MATKHPSRFLTTVALAASAGAQTGWTQHFPNPQPQARGWHALTYDLLRGTTVMFGGWANQPLADTWEWTGVNWSPRATVNSPSARCCHSLAYDLSRGRVLLFGGSDGTQIDQNDTWEYDGIDWTLLQPANQPGPRREARMTMDLVSGRVLLFGGGAGGNGTPVFADTWEWSGSNWTQRNPTTSPPARWSHGMTTDFARGRIVLFGGGSGNGPSALGDTWTWNGTNWSQVQTVPSPPASLGTALAYDNARDLVVQFGGQPVVAATWLFDGASWRRDLRAFSPQARAWETVAHDIARGRTVLFGGNSIVADTWEYDTGVVARWSPFGSGCPGTAGVPVLRPVVASLPIIGTTFNLELLGIPSSAAAISIGFSNQLWNGGALPFGLGALGMTGCTLHASPDVLFFTPVSAGRATLAWAVPNATSLIGVPFFNQGFVLDPGANPLGATVSNAGAGIIGPF